MAAPTLVDAKASEFDATGTTETTASMSWASGDLVVVLGITEDNTVATISTPTGLTNLTLSAVSGSPTNVASSCKGYAWSGVATGSGSGTVQTTVSPADKAAGIVVFIFRGSDGVGATAFNASLGSTTTQDLTRTQANSLIVQIWGDWNAVNDTTVTWTPSGETQRVADYTASHATFFAASWGDQGATGTTAYGFSGFAGGDMTAITLEIKGTAGGGGATPHSVFGLALNGPLGRVFG